MPPICDYKCDNCDSQMPRGWGGHLFIEDDNGKRIPCSHPMEEYDILRVLGHHFSESFKADFPKVWVYRRLGVPEKYLAEEEIIYRRLGYNSLCVCTACLHQFEADLSGGRDIWRRFYSVMREGDARVCPKCGSNSVQTALDLVGKPCPKCKTGTFREIETGLWT